MLKYILIPLLAISASAFVLDEKVCKKSGFFAVVDNTPTFYGCFKNNAGGYIFKILHCPSQQVFNSAAGVCINSVNTKNIVALAEGDATRTTGDVIVPVTTPPPDTTTKSTTEHFTDPTDAPTEEPTDAPTEEPTEAPTEAPTEHPTEEPTEAPTEGPTDEPEHSEPTDEPNESTQEPEHSEPTEGPTEEPSEPTEDPENTEPTDDPTDEPSESTDDPTESTDEPSESTDDPTETTDDPTDSTDDPTESTDDPTGSTDDPNETTTPKPFTCPTSGFFPTDGDCKTYIYCYNSPETGRTSPVYLRCPQGQEFNPCTLICDSDYDCGECGQETFGKKTHKVYNCDMEGTFVDRHDNSKYFECKWDQKKNKFQSRHLTCPENQVFHLLTGRCGRRHKLPLNRFNRGH